jgi:hypothetical protein
MNEEKSIDLDPGPKRSSALCPFKYAIPGGYPA